MTENEADDHWTEFGAAGDPDRAPTPGRLDDLRLNRELVALGYRIEPATVNGFAWKAISPDGRGTMYARTHEAIWSAARSHYRRTLITKELK